MSNNELQFSLLLPEILIYPHIEEEFNLCERAEEPLEPIVDRIQYILEPNRPMLLIRHIKVHHWCGYVPIPEEAWRHIEDRVRSIFGRITYDGYSTQYITWMARNSEGKLKTPVNIVAPKNDEVADHWVGFDTMRGPGFELATRDEAFQQLTFLENIIFRLRRGDLK